MLSRLSLSKIPFDLDHTLSCGQAFRWKKNGKWWIGVVRQSVLKLQQTNASLIFERSTRDLDEELVRRYLRLDDDLHLIYSQIAKDKHVHEAVKQFYGLRLLRQEPWECLVSYVCATYKSIPAIRQIIHNLSRQFGKPIYFEGSRFYGFPEPEALAKADLRELRLCKLGYRAERVRKTARLVYSDEFDLESLRGMPYDEAKEMLLSLPGVGPKVADCVLLFSLDRLEACPIDTWMKRVFLDYYSERFDVEFVDRLRSKKSMSPREYNMLYAFGKEYFGAYLGYAQEYLYHLKRCQALSVGKV